MIGAKITLVLIVLTLILIYAAKILYCMYDPITQFQIQMHGDAPKLYSIIAVMTSVLVLADIIGIIYSLIYFLFFN